MEKMEKEYLQYQKTEFLDTLPRTPFFTFEHSLFIYPLSVSFEKCRPPDHPKLKPNNILLEVILKEDNSTYGAPRINHDGRLIHKAMCSVTFEESSPIFYEEIKIQLPLPIKPTQHILFNFYHLMAERNLSKRRKVIENIQRDGLLSQEENFTDTVQKVLIGHSVLALTNCIDPQDNTHSLIVFKV